MNGSSPAGTGKSMVGLTAVGRVRLAPCSESNVPSGSTTQRAICVITGAESVHASIELPPLMLYRSFGVSVRVAGVPAVRAVQIALERTGSSGWKSDVGVPTGPPYAGFGMLTAT